MKLDSDYKHDTDYFGYKFMSKVESIFNGLPKPKDWRSLYINDLPLLTSIDDEVQAVAVHRSNNQNRDATQGQKAMAFAMVFPDPAKLKRKAMFPEETSDAGFNKATLSKARYVLRNSPMGIAGITPPIIITDIDPKLAVHRSNNQNRDATPGQKAMATAMAFPEAKRGMHSELKNLTGSAKVYLSQSRYVLRNSPMVEGERYPRRCLSANVHRRHLTKGQQAMAVALAWPWPRETALYEAERDLPRLSR